MCRRRKTRESSPRLRTRRVTVRPMRRRDLDEMHHWRRFVDPLYAPFDFPRRSAAEWDQWFRWRSKDPTRRLYVIQNEQHQVIGSLTLREIDNRRSARLGITLGADFVSQGYGTEALRRFCDYYFDTLGFERIILDVAAINQRAIRCYLGLGFAQTDQHYQPADSQAYQVIMREPAYRHVRRFFRAGSPRPRLLFYDMELTREAWHLRRSQELDERTADGHGR
jgi:RimJ/RimL family protein N-acetyltransferase